MFRNRYCRGQAMNEFVVMTAGVLLILFMVVPTLGKLLDMSFQTHQLARYATWERTVWFDNGDQPGETTEPDYDVAVRSDSAISALRPSSVERDRKATNNRFIPRE